MFWFGLLVAFGLVVIAIRSPQFREWVASDPWSRVSFPSTTQGEHIRVAFKTPEVRKRFDNLIALSESGNVVTVVRRSLATYEACVECVNAGGQVILKHANGETEELAVIWRDDRRD